MKPAVLSLAMMYFCHSLHFSEESKKGLCPWKEDNVLVKIIYIYIHICEYMENNFNSGGKTILLVICLTFMNKYDIVSCLLKIFCFGDVIYLRSKLLIYT
jgi:hypothetical protein